MNRTLKLEEELKGVHSIGIAGHIRPDGDAVGSCLGLYLYLSENYPELAVQVYLEDFPKSFMMLKGTETISHEFHADAPHDLFIALQMRSGLAMRCRFCRMRSIRSALITISAISALPMPTISGRMPALLQRS